MKEYRRKKHDYLGMDLDLSLYGEIRVTITDYLKKIVSGFTETIQGIVNPSSREPIHSEVIHL